MLQDDAEIGKMKSTERRSWEGRRIKIRETKNTLRMAGHLGFMGGKTKDVNRKCF